MVKTTDYYGAINEFRNFVNRFPTSELVDDAWYVMGRTYEQVSDRNNAIMAYQQIVYNYPGSGFYSQALERLNYLQNNGETYPVPPTYPPGNPIPPSYPGNDNYISDYELYNRGHSALVSGNTNKAISYFDELLKRYPSSSYADDAYFWKGQARMQQKNYLDAIRQFENLQATFPGSELYGSSIYVMADCEYEYARLNAANRIYFQKAAGHYTWYQQAYPNNGQYSAQALVRAGECYEMMGEYSNAKYYYQQTIDLYPNTSAALKAKEKLNGFW
jgi:TolA-binding protein